MYRIDVVPMGAPRQTQRDRWARRPVIVRYHGYKDQLRLALPGYELPRDLIIEFYLPMPKSWSKKKRSEMQGQHHDQKPDVDNLCKAFMDTWKDGEDDKVVWGLTARKFWAEEGYIILY